MKIFDAVYTAAVFLQLDALCDAMNDESFDKANWKTTLPNDTAGELDILLRCCRLVLHELSESGFPLKTTAEADVQEGRVAFVDLPKKVTDIYAVEQYGKQVPFKAFYDCITLPIEGKCRITYSFAPPEVNLGDESPYGGNKPSARLVAYGIAREYSLIGGMTDNATIWDGRFVSCAEEEMRPRGEHKVRMRRWK